MTFPVTRSVLAEQALALFLSDTYPILLSCEVALLKTFVNDTYLVTTRQQRFIFRVYRFDWRSPEEIQEELKFINHLHTAGISVSRPVPDGRGRSVQRIEAPEGERFGVLFTYAEGDKVFNAAEETHAGLGRFMAAMHQAAAGITLRRPALEYTLLVADPMSAIQNYLNEADREFLQETASNLIMPLSNDGLLRAGAVHLDVWADNLHIDQQGAVTLFDFDFCAQGPLVYDLAFYLLQLLLTTTDPKSFHASKAAFLAGYEAITPLTPHERERIPAFAMALCFYYLGIQQRLFSTLFFNAEHVRRFVDLRMRRWLAFHNMQPSDLRIR